MARANTAAIIVEQLAAQVMPEEHTEPNTPTTPKSKHKVIQTAAATYDNGNVYVIGNPLETTHEIRCPKCLLPRLLSPAIATDDLNPDPTKQYCKRQPFVSKPGHDIYGQPFVESAPVKGARKNKEKDRIGDKKQAEAGSSFDSPAPSPPATDPSSRSAKHIFPNIKCHICNHSVKVNRFAPHLVKCMGIGGRASGRAAALKINGQANGSQNGSTPPASQRSTPLPPNTKKSPQKRDAEGFDDDADLWKEDNPKKKKIKQQGVTKKWKSAKLKLNGKEKEKEKEKPVKELQTLSLSDPLEMAKKEAEKEMKPKPTEGSIPPPSQTTLPKPPEIPGASQSMPLPS